MIAAGSDGCVEDDERMASVVLELALEEHPAHLNIEEVVRLSATDATRFSDRDAVITAIRQLVRDGLLHRQGNFVFATRPAVRSAELRI